MHEKKQTGIFLLCSLALDAYLYRGILWMFPHASDLFLWFWFSIYGIATIITIIYLWRYYFNTRHYKAQFQNVYTTTIAYYFVSKLIFTLSVLAVDIPHWLNQPFTEDWSQIVMVVGLSIAALPLLLIAYGMLWGAHFYKIYHVDIPIKNLPEAFEGFTIGQVSDMHLGSFFRKTDVGTGIELLMHEQPDLVVFTGDMVNFSSEETQGYEVLLSHLEAPYGVYATFGNHDYGMYRKDWVDEQLRVDDIENLKLFFQFIGWDLLLNEHRIIEKDGAQIALLGVENWGRHFQKYGSLDDAMEGIQDQSIPHVLLSHDPSHWEDKVLGKEKHIDVTLAGHTHGFQMGIEYKKLKMSPAGIKYKRWAGLYKEGEQYLYVNRGFGYLGFPGRIGMRPEITILRLKKQ